MSGTATAIFMLSFVLLIIGNFVCQIYVAIKLYSQHGTVDVIKGIAQGTRTFILGWQGAKLLGIENVMIIWSGMLTILVMQTCFAMYLSLAK
jgi:hypothetical protein